MLPRLINLIQLFKAKQEFGELAVKTRRYELLKDEVRGKIESTFSEVKKKEQKIRLGHMYTRRF